MISLLNPRRWVKVSHLRTALACSSPGKCWSSPRKIVYGAPASLARARTPRGAPLRSHSCCTFGELAFRPLFLVLRLTLATELICWTYVMWLILNFTIVSCSSAGLCQTRMEMSSQPSNFLRRARDRSWTWGCLVSNSFFGAFPDQTDELPELPQTPQGITWTSAIKWWSFTKTAGLRLVMKQRDGAWKSVGTLFVRCKPGHLSEPWMEGECRPVCSFANWNSKICVAGPYIATPRLPYQHEDGHVFEEGHGSYWWPDRISRSYKCRHGLRCVCRDGHIVDVQSLTFPDLIKNNWIFEGSFDASEDCNAKNKVFL